MYESSSKWIIAAHVAGCVDPHALNVPCPVCRGDVKPYLLAEHREHMNMIPADNEVSD